jgi:hypothetical protein
MGLSLHQSPALCAVMSDTPYHSGVLRAAGVLYDRFALLCPFLLMAVPPIVAAWPKYGEVLDLIVSPPAAILALGLWCLGPITLHVAENRQRTLRQSWGGRPGARLLRHGDSQLSSKTKQILHARLKRKGCGSMPSPEVERLDPRQAEDAYSFALAHCDHWFRDRITFRELWQKRTTYEFLLNCVAMRWLGAGSCVVTLLSSCTQSPRMSIGTQAEATMTLSLPIGLISPSVLIACGLMFYLWVFYLTPQRVHTAAWSLDHHILQCLAASGSRGSRRATRDRK